MGKTLRNSNWEEEWCKHGLCRRITGKRRGSRKYLHRDGVGKGPGFEYWSRRPLSGHGPGSDTKRMVNRIERRTARQDVRDEVENG